jgi:hypothetical protein
MNMCIEKIVGEVAILEVLEDVLEQRGKAEAIRVSAMCRNHHVSQCYTL